MDFMGIKIIKDMLSPTYKRTLMV